VLHDTSQRILIQHVHVPIWKEGREGNGPDPAKIAEYNETVELLAKEFAAKVPKLEYSPAEIMSLLFANKQSPRQAVDSVEVWMEKIKEEKRKVKRADSWVLSA
jgi:chaperone BCS1